ncbi:Lactose transport system permease protein LacF [compost metagenome]
MKSYDATGLRKQHSGINTMVRVWIIGPFTIFNTETGEEYMQKSMKRYFALFALPTIIAFSVAFVIPFLLGVYLSFTEFTTVNDAKWVGLSNYIKAFSNQDFINALWFTVKFTLVSILTINVFAFTLAIWGLVVLMNWQLIGYMMIIYVAGIQNVPKDVIEVAKIDGASRFQVLRNVTLPLVMPSITISLFLTLSNSFKLFDQNLALTAGAPSKQTAMLALDIYNTFYGKTGWEGVGQAKAVVFFVLVALIALIQLLITRRKEVES